MAELERFRIEEIDEDGWAASAGAKVREALETEPGRVWKSLRLPLLDRKVAAAVGERLAQIDPIALFAQGWAKIREIRALPPEKTAFVKLGKHALEKDVHPLVTVNFMAWESRPVRFTLTISAMIEAVELEVRDRHIRAASGGTCDLALDLKYGEQSLTGEKTLRRYDLPFEHRFKGEGIPISFGGREEPIPEA